MPEEIVSDSDINEMVDGCKRTYVARVAVNNVLTLDGAVVA